MSDVGLSCWMNIGILVAKNQQVNDRWAPGFYCLNSLGISSLQTRIENPIFDWYVKVSKIDGCQLVRQADMEFDFYIGSCQSFDQPTPKILLCFDYSHTSECHTYVIWIQNLWNNNLYLFRFDGNNFDTAGSSKFSHRNTLGMAYYNGKALTTGCNDSSSCYVKTEIMDMSTLEWSNGPDYSLAS